MNKLNQKVITGLVTLMTIGSNLPAVFAQSYTYPNTPSSTSSTAPATKSESHKGLHFNKNVIITAINGNSVTATDKAGTSYTIDASSAKLIRRFGAASNLAEFTVGDKLLVQGSLSAVGSTSVIAKSIKDNSIQKRNGTVTGTITGISSNTLTVQNNKITYTVTLTSSTKFSSAHPKKYQIGSASDLKVGDKITVRGLKDTTAKTIAADSLKVRSRATTTTPVTSA
jgi:hypothetical protein